MNDAKTKLTYEDLENWPFKLGASFRLVAKELQKKGWEFTLFENNTPKKSAYFLAVKDGHTELLASLKYELFTNLNSRLGYLITTSKARTYEYVQRFNLPVPRSIYLDPDQPMSFDDLKGWDGVVVKPVNGSSGKGIKVGVTDQAVFDTAIDHARTIDEKAIVQELIRGDDYRLLFLDYKLFAAIRREPAYVVGDGEHSIQALIELHNAIPKPEDYQGTTSTIKIAEVARTFGVEFLQEVPVNGNKVLVSDKANLSLGGDAYDVTDTVHPSYQQNLAPMIQSLGLRICGIDVMTKDITHDMIQTGAKLLEVNAAPTIRPHLYPTGGTARNVVTKIVAMLEQHAYNAH